MLAELTQPDCRKKSGQPLFRFESLQKLIGFFHNVRSAAGRWKDTIKPSRRSAIDFRSPRSTGRPRLHEVTGYCAVYNDDIGIIQCLQDFINAFFSVSAGGTGHDTRPQAIQATSARPFLKRAYNVLKLRFGPPERYACSWDGFATQLDTLVIVPDNKGFLSSTRCSIRSPPRRFSQTQTIAGSGLRGSAHSWPLFVFSEQQFNYTLAGVSRPGRFCVDFQPFLHGADTGCQEGSVAVSFHLHQADPAGARGAYPFQVAQRGDIIPGVPGCLQDACSFSATTGRLLIISLTFS